MRGWIEHEPNVDDLRKEFLSLTAAGRRGHTAIVADMRAFEERLLIAVAILTALDMLEKALSLSS